LALKAVIEDWKWRHTRTSLREQNSGEIKFIRPEKDY